MVFSSRESRVGAIKVVVALAMLAFCAFLVVDFVESAQQRAQVSFDAEWEATDPWNRRPPSWWQRHFLGIE